MLSTVSNFFISPSNSKVLMWPHLGKVGKAPDSEVTIITSCGQQLSMWWDSNNLKNRQSLKACITSDNFLKKNGSIQLTFPCGSLGWKSVCTLFSGSALKTNLQNSTNPESFNKIVLVPRDYKNSTKAERFNSWLTFCSAQAHQLHLPCRYLCVSGPHPLERFPSSPCQEQLWSETHQLIIELILPL